MRLAFLKTMKERGITMKKEFANVSEETLKEDLQYFIGRLREYDILVD